MQQPVTQQQQQQQQGQSSNSNTFAERINALPTSINAVYTRAIGLPETNHRLFQQLQYWHEHDGPETTASAPGAKAAERSRRYIQHLLDRGGDSAPKCPVFLELGNVQLQLKANNNNNVAQQDAQNNNNLKDFLSSEEQSQLASLVPLTYVEALTYLPSLGRFQQREVEGMLNILRSA